MAFLVNVLPVTHISSYMSTWGSSIVTDCLATLLLDLDFHFPVYVIGTEGHDLMVLFGHKTCAVYWMHFSNNIDDTSF